jgi:tetratricopeptide (TPR) repeat protein
MGGGGLVALEPQRGPWPWLAGLALALALVLGGLIVMHGVVAPQPVEHVEVPVPVTTLLPVTDLFKRCEDAVTGARWGEAVESCRRVHARDRELAGLGPQLAAAYVGRGKERLEAQDFSRAEADFQEALSYQADSAEAQQQLQWLTLYREADKARASGDWESAIGQFSAVYEEAPEYLQSLGEASLRHKLFATWLGWGQAALAADDLPSAAQRCGQALQLLPDDVEAQDCFDAAGGAAGAGPGDGRPPGDAPPADGPPGDRPPAGLGRD